MFDELPPGSEDRRRRGAGPPFRHELSLLHRVSIVAHMEWSTVNNVAATSCTGNRKALRPDAAACVTVNRGWGVLARPAGERSLGVDVATGGLHDLELQMSIFESAMP